jgi:hypothetical protein
MRLRWRFRWYEVVPEVVLAAGLTFFLVDQTDAATSAFESTRAIVLMVVVGAVWLGGRVLAAGFVPWAPARLGVFAVAAAGVLAVVVLPAYDDETVVEAFPSAANRSTTIVTSTTSAPASTPTTTTEAAAVATTTTTTTAAPEPVRLRVGMFTGIDHEARGTVALYQQPDGRFVVGLEEIDIQPGPDYDVYVVPGADRDEPDGGVRLDDLRGNQGTQYYEVTDPAVDFTVGEWTVLVWCQTFDVPVANATPT